MGIKLLQHPLPNKYESLASYMFRLSRANCCSISWLDEAFKISLTLKSLDKYNIYITSECMIKISKATGISYTDIINMTINKFNMWTQDSYYFKKNYELTKFINMENKFFCPQCVKETNSEKIYWNLNLIKVCLLHKVQLISECSNCGNKLAYLDFEMRECCNCSTKLENMDANYVFNDDIINSQHRIYTIFDIFDAGEEYKTIDFKDFAKADFAKFIINLDSAAMKYITLLKDKELFKYDSKYSIELNQLIAVKEILASWPNNFYKFIDIIAEHESNNIKFELEKLRSWHFSPSYFFKNISREFQIEKIHFLKEYLQQYFYIKYNFEYFSKIFKPILIENKFIEFNYAKEIFDLPGILTKKYINIYCQESNKNILYLDLEQVLDFFKQFIKDNSFNINNEYKSLVTLSQTLHELDADYIDIFNTILTNKIDIKIDPNHNGMLMLYVHEKEMKIAILELIIDKLKNS